MAILDRIGKLPLRLFYSAAGKLFYQDERIARRLNDYFPCYSSAWGEFRNQLSRTLGSSFSRRIQGIVIEPTDACNLKCRHCTPQQLPGDRKGYMDFELFKKILDENPGLTCLILTRNGEPFLHPHIFDMIKYTRERNIYVSVYTNGLLLNEERIDKLFESNLNELNFSLEGIGEFYRYNRGVDYETSEAIIKRILRERLKRRSSLKIGINAVVCQSPSKALEVKKEWDGIVDHVSIEPLMGKKALPRRRACRTLWRNLVITWEGDVLPCCVDMQNTLRMGNVREGSLAEISNSPSAREIRRRHTRKDFPEICRYCDPYFG